MSRSILAHLSFNFYHSCQADYRHALYLISETFYGPNLARVSPRTFRRVFLWMHDSHIALDISLQM